MENKGPEISGPAHIALVPLGYELISVTQNTVMTIGLNPAEFDAHFHTDLNIINGAVGNLRQKLNAVFQLRDADGIRRLVGELRRRYPDNRIGQQLSAIGKNHLLEFAMTADRTDQAIRKYNLAALGALARLKAITMFAFSPDL
jgi:hypothetical protein